MQADSGKLEELEEALLDDAVVADSVAAGDGGGGGGSGGGGADPRTRTVTLRRMLTPSSHVESRVPLSTVHDQPLIDRARELLQGHRRQ